jgi:hypothetical protein
MHVGCGIGGATNGDKWCARRTYGSHVTRARSHVKRHPTTETNITWRAPCAPCRNHCVAATNNPVARAGSDVSDQQ